MNLGFLFVIEIKKQKIRNCNIMKAVGFIHSANNAAA